MSPPSKLSCLRAMPVLQVRDLTASIAYYGLMKFGATGVWGEGVGAFAIVQRGHITIGMEQTSAPPDTSGAFSAYLYVADVNAIHAEFVEAGVKILRGPMDRTYGCRDLEVTDADGHRLCFGQVLDPDPARGPGLAAVSA